MTASSGGHQHVKGRSVGRGNTAPVDVVLSGKDDWMADGLCANSDDPDLWFREEDFEEASRTCGRCPVNLECLQFKISEDLSFGVWGGAQEGRQEKYYTRRVRTLKARRGEDYL